VIDSIGGMESKIAFEKDAEDVVMGKNAQVITRMAKQLAVLARENNITVLYVNQLRADLSGRGFDKAAGPKAFGYSTTTSVSLARKGGLTDSVHFAGTGDNKEEVGRLYAAKVQRNRIAAQGRKAEFWFSNQPSQEFGPVGIDRVDEAVNVGIRMGAIKQSGGFYTPPGYKKAIRGRETLVATLRKDIDVVEEIRRVALESVSADVTPEIETEFELERSDG
jgi:recombination protein RecA